jgi:pyruvate carboxylase subunit B
MDKFPDIIKAMGEVVRSGGFGTSVTPVSQFYFQQAFNNVLFGKWEKIADGYGKMVLGYFGKTPVSPDPKIVKLAAEQLGLEPTDLTPLEINDADSTKGLEVARKRLKEENIEDTDENVFIVATCKEKGIDFLKGEATIGVRKIVPEDESKAVELKSADHVHDTDSYVVTVNGKKHSVTFEDNKATVNGKVYVVDLHPDNAVATVATSSSSAPAATASTEAIEVKSQMPGAVIALSIAEGGHVNEGDTIMVLEAMKMEIKVTSPATGSVGSILVAKGDQVVEGQVLATVV